MGTPRFPGDIFVLEMKWSNDKCPISPIVIENIYLSNKCNSYVLVNDLRYPLYNKVFSNSA